MQQLPVDFSREGSVLFFQGCSDGPREGQVSRHDRGETLGACRQQPNLVPLCLVVIDALDHFWEHFGGDGSSPGALGHFLKISYLVARHESLRTFPGRLHPLRRLTFSDEVALLETEQESRGAI